MSIEERLEGAFADLDSEFATGTSVAEAIAKVAPDYDLSREILRMRAERQFGSLSLRRCLLILKRRSQEDVREFLATFEVNSDWQSRWNIDYAYEDFLSQKYKKKVSTQRKALAEEALGMTFKADFIRREADRKKRGVRLRRW